MTQPHILVDIDDAASVIMKFIGSEKCNEITKAIEDNAKSGFMAGLSFALCLIMAECTAHSEEKAR